MNCHPKAIELLENLDETSKDYTDCKKILENLQLHKINSEIQTNYFLNLWNNPPDNTLLVAEDAGKRFVLEGKGCAHVMMLR